MKFAKRTIAASIAMLLLATGIVYTISGSTVDAKGHFVSDNTVKQSEAVSGSFFGAGGTVHVSNEIDGDVYVAGQSVTITGDVKGDVLAAGQNVTISGTIDGSVRVFAQSVTVTGEVKGSLSVATQALVVGKSAIIERDASFAGQVATIEGQIGRDINAAVESLHISGSVGRDIIYMSEKELERSSGSVVSGSIEQIAPPKESKHDDSVAAMIWSKLFFASYVLFAVVIGAALLTLLFPRWIRSVNEYTKPKPWKAMFAGFVVAAAVPVAVVILLTTLVGAPVAIALLLAYLTLIAIGVVFTSYYLGGLILRDKTNLIFRSFVGALVYVVLLSIPLLGFFVAMLGSFIGTGAVVLDIYNRAVLKPEVKLAAKKPVKKPTKS